MSKRDEYIRFLEIEHKATQVVRSVKTTQQAEVARNYVHLACNEMMNTEYYLKGNGDRGFNSVAHLFTRLDRMVFY
jgi:hypothetical protein